MSIQRTDWGEIHWLDATDFKGAVSQMRVGIVTLNALRTQPAHIHYDEQALYVLEGEAESTIDGACEHLSPGSLLHLPAGVVHEIVNIKNEPFKHLLVSNSHPAGFVGTNAAEDVHAKEAAWEAEESVLAQGSLTSENSDVMYIAVEAVRTQFLEMLPYGYALFDHIGNLLLQSKSFPEYCRTACSVDTCPGEAECMLHGKELDVSAKQTFCCTHGMEVYQYPIVHNKHVIGYLQAGYIRRSGDGAAPNESVYDAPESVVDGVKALMARIVKAIQNYCEFEQFRQELAIRDSQIASAQEQEGALLQDLQDARYAITDLRINNHFLFNTLNSMASIALDGGQTLLYQSIVDLSKMFHYTLRTQSAIVPLHKELEYVRAYLQLQELRFGEQLHIQINVDPHAAGQFVPFNFLQPIVENAFVHGFHDEEEKNLLVEASLDQGLVIRVVNSGRTLADSEYRFANQSVRSNTAHGLSMVHAKLLALYGEQGTISLEPAEWEMGGTAIVVRIPVAESFKDDLGL